MKITKEKISKLEEDFDQSIEEYHRAAVEFIKGNPEPYKKLFSQREDVSLANPFGPVKRGWKEVADSLERASSQYSEGKFTGFEAIAKYATSDLGYVVEIERFNARMIGKQNTVSVALLVTRILRIEDGKWRIVHLTAATTTV